MPRGPSSARGKRSSLGANLKEIPALKLAYLYLKNLRDTPVGRQSSLLALCNEVGAKFKVRPGSLRMKFLKARVSKLKQHGNQLLFDYEEQLLIGILQALAAQVEAPGPETVIKMATYFTQRRKLKPPSQQWAREFLNTYEKELKRKSEKRSDKSRIAARIPVETNAWLKYTEDYLDTLPCTTDPHLIINIDETRADPDLPGHPTRRITSTHMRDAQCTTLSASDFYTAVYACNAAGRTLFALYIYKKSRSRERPSRYLPIG
jgi:hypothetical protein